MKFRVFLNNGPRKVTKSLFKIGFLHDTVVKECDLLNDCLYASFTPFPAVLNDTIDQNYLVELVGYVVTAGMLYHVDAMPSKLGGYCFSFVRKDIEGCHIKCEAYGQAAIDFNSGYMDSISSNVPVVCILRWWRVVQPLIGTQDVRVYSDPPVSKVLFNADIPAFVEMLKLAVENESGYDQPPMK